MSAFWIAAALLAAAALALVLRPLGSRRAGTASRSELNASVYRDQLRELEADLRAGTLAPADYERSRREIERRLLEDVQGDPAGQSPRRSVPGTEFPGRRVMLSIAAGIPVVALAVYFAIGNPGALDPRSREQQAVGAKEIEAMVQRLADRLEQSPEDLEGWKMLGRSYTVLGRFAEAANAYSKAAIRAPRDPQVLADLADALAMARGRNMKGEPEELVQRALQLDPNNLKALALAGTARFESQDYAGAVRYWERMLPLVPADSDDARMIASNVQEARSLAGDKAPPAQKAKPAARAASLRGTVKLSPKLAAKASPDDTVFIFARAAEGPPMPLAVLRKKVRDLPATFSLDDSMAMAQGLQLSGFPRVIVGARISRSGSATPQSGDLQGASPVVANTAGSVAVTIDKVVP